MMIERTHQYIERTWERAMLMPKDMEAGFQLPYPCVPPCVTGEFRCLFYWDTFYTNLGLVADGKSALAKHNVDNLIYLLNKYGFVPNANSESGSKWCSQPPYLHWMVQTLEKYVQDESWLKKAYFALKNEYHFWMTERMTSIGLNRHYHQPLNKQDLVEYYDYVATERIKIPMNIEDDAKAEKAHSYIAAAECGLDWSPRFRDGAAHMIPVDLNANLYGMENNLYRWALMFEPDEASKFLENAEERKRLMNQYCLDKDGLYYDYDMRTEKRNYFYSTSQFMPFVKGLIDDKEALKELVDMLQKPFGVVSTQEDVVENLSYQWSYPNTWAPDNYLAFLALKKNNLLNEAKTVATRYLETVSRNYAKTGLLWEKYDGIDGEVSKKNEYEVPEMLGWTGGVFEVFYKYIYNECGGFPDE